MTYAKLNWFKQNYFDRLTVRKEMTEFLVRHSYTWNHLTLLDYT